MSVRGGGVSVQVLVREEVQEGGCGGRGRDLMRY